MHGTVRLNRICFDAFAISDKSPLLLCQPASLTGDSITDSSVLNSINAPPVCILNRDLQVYKGMNRSFFLMFLLLHVIVLMKLHFYSRIEKEKLVDVLLSNKTKLRFKSK